MAAAVEDWLTLLGRLYPWSWAEPWDRVGLQVGDQGWPAERILVALDPTEEVVAEAADLGCGLLITHHPLVFHALERLTLDDPVARTALQAAGRQVAVAACHTNADVASPGVSDILADALGVEVTGVLHPTHAGTRMKLVTFVPTEATAKVLDALAGAGAGVIGEYSHCSFQVRGTGTFLPSESAHPVVGDRGALNQVEEDRLEIVVPLERVGAAVRAMLDAHPYEEVAYDLYPLSGPSGLGLGRLGRLPQEVSAAELVDRCRDALGTSVRVAGPADRRVRSVAVCGGSGAGFLEDVILAGADAYVTGDLKHHPALKAASEGLAVIDAGHDGTERPFVAHLAERLGAEKLGEVLISEVRTDPFGDPR